MHLMLWLPSSFYNNNNNENSSSRGYHNAKHQSSKRWYKNKVLSIKIRMQFRGVMDEKNYVWGALSPKAFRMTDWCKSRKHKPLQCLRDLGLGLPCSKFFELMVVCILDYLFLMS